MCGRFLFGLLLILPLFVSVFSDTYEYEYEYEPGYVVETKTVQTKSSGSRTETKNINSGGGGGGSEAGCETGSEGGSGGEYRTGSGNVRGGGGGGGFVSGRGSVKGGGSGSRGGNRGGEVDYAYSRDGNGGGQRRYEENVRVVKSRTSTGSRGGDGYDEEWEDSRRRRPYPPGRDYDRTVRYESRRRGPAVDDRRGYRDEYEYGSDGGSRKYRTEYREKVEIEDDREGRNPWEIAECLCGRDKSVCFNLNCAKILIGGKCESEGSAGTEKSGGGGGGGLLGGLLGGGSSGGGLLSGLLGGGGGGTGIVDTAINAAKFVPTWAAIILDCWPKLCLCWASNGGPSDAMQSCGLDAKEICVSAVPKCAWDICCKVPRKCSCEYDACMNNHLGKVWSDFKKCAKNSRS